MENENMLDKSETKVPEITDIDFGKLTVAQVDYIEMTRQIQRLEEIGINIKSAFENYKNAIEALETVLECSVSVNLDSVMERINKIGLRMEDGIVGKMQKQLNAYYELNDDIKNRFSDLRNLVVNLYDEDGNWQYENINLHGEGVNYNSVLKRNEFLKLAEISDEDIEFMLSTSDDGSIKSANIYKTIEENYGLKDGKAALEYLISQAQSDPTLSARDKAVKTALILNNVCAKNEVRMPYVFTNMHENPTLDGIVRGADCSTYTSFLMKQGNENLDFGTTYTLDISEHTTRLSEGYTVLEPGDLLIRNPGGEKNAHVLFFVGYDQTGNLICAENTVDSGVSGSRLKAYTLDELKRNGYNGYIVDYEFNKVIGA